MAKPNKTKVPLTAPKTQPFHNPFGALPDLAHRVEDVAPSSSSSSSSATSAPSISPPPQSPSPSPLSLTQCGKIVIRRERKGRGGKTVTTITGITVLSAQNLTMLVEKMRKALGCGAHIEDGTIIVLQGPLGERAAQYLRTLGATQCVIGS